MNLWVVKMAWRESRTHRKRLLLFVSSIVLGVAALVAINSFGSNLEDAVNNQSKSLLGADLVVRSRQPLTPEASALIDSLGQERSRETRFRSMVYFTDSEDMRLAEIRALEGDFPFYGFLDTVPPAAAESFRTGPYALVDERLMLQFDAKVGDPVKVGASTFTIAGRLRQIPGEALASAFISPRVFIPLSSLEQTELIQVGSRVDYRTYVKFPAGTDVELVVAEMEPELTQHRLRTDTVEERRARLGRAMENLYRFLNLVGFIALLLGGIGVASAIHLYIRQKLSTVATLRCLGANARQAFSIYLVQATVMGVLGALCGALIGVAVQELLPWVVNDFLPVRIPLAVRWGPIVQGIGTGLTVVLLFALLPLVTVRRISPLLTLRFSFEEDVKSPREPLQWLVYTALLIAIFSFAVWQAEQWIHGFNFAAGTVLVFLLLIGVAKSITVLVRRYFPTSWNYVWRQGLANLYRPNNQTVVLMLALGLGTFLILTLYLLQSTLLNQVALAGSGDKPNLVMFDIQNDQRDAILQAMESHGLTVLQDVPIVTMRLGAVNGKPVEEIAEKPDSSASRWALFREYRSTYRDHLIDSEELLEGVLRGRTGDSPIFVSLEERIASELNISLGDELTFNVQGIPIETTVGSLRRVDWQRLQTNCFVVFPTNVLEQAPQFHVLATQTGSPQVSADLQRGVVRRFPNVSTVDLALVLETVDMVLDKVSFVIRFMALFSIITGMVVLIGAVVASRYQRARESVLLRTLGASRAQIRKIMLVEYLFLGTFAALTGLMLAIASSWALATFLFEAPFVVEALPLLAALFTVVGLTLLVGMLNSRGLCDLPPLEILRGEA